MLSGSLPSFVQASTDANYTLDNSSGSMVMDLNSGSLVVNADFSTATGWSNATVRLHNNAHIFFNSTQTLADLELHDHSAASDALGNTTTLGNMLKLSGLAIDSTATLDLGDNAMILHYIPSQEAAAKSLISGLVTSGYASGAWNGLGIDSSAAANDPSHNTALGWFDQYEVGVVSVNGDSADLADGYEMVVKYTVYGDADLSGKIDASDSSQMSYGMHGGGTGWGFGDFNYDGHIDSTDSQILNTNALANLSLSNPQYKPGLQVQALPFTAYSYAAWSGDIATFYDATHGGGVPADYTATMTWNDGSTVDAQITQDPNSNNLRVNIDSVIPTDATVFTVQIAYAGPDAGTGAASSASAVVTLDQLPPNAVASPDAVYTISGVAGAVQINVTAGSISFNTNVANDGNYWQNAAIDVSGSGHLIFNSPETLGSLQISDSATVAISQGNSESNGNLLQLNSLSVDSTATLDLGDNSMILYYATGDESYDLSMVQSLLTTGYKGGAWNGVGIDSSTAANDTTKSTAVGYADNNELGSTSFAGVNLPDLNQILVRYTVYGDSNLNGVVDGTDFGLFAGGGSGWEFGDYNYDGNTADNTDLGIIDAHARESLTGLGYDPAFQLQALPIQPAWNTPFDGDIATFSDTVNPGLPASDYLAQVYWGSGNLYVAPVYATSTPGTFRINTISPVFTTADPIMMITLQYADGSGHQSESAIAGEPIDVLQLPPGVNASANAAYSLSGGPGSVQLNLTAGSLTFDTNVSKDSNYFQNLSFTVSGSAHAYFNSPENFNELNINDSATVSVSKGSGGSNGNLLNVQTLSIGASARLDLSDNGLIDWYAFANETAATTQMGIWLKNGYAGGAWNGPGIDSSVAHDDSTHATGLGWMDNGYNYAAVGTDPSYSSFDGVSLPTKNQLLVQYTYNGDANLNGQVDSTDSGLWHSGSLGHGYLGWVYGDFNYDGYINSNDFSIWQTNYGLSADMANNPHAFKPVGIIINPMNNVPFSGDIATFTDVLNPSNTNASIYQAYVDWGDGNFVTAQVTATSTPGSFRINAISPPLTNPNAVMTVTIQYAPSTTYIGRPAAVSEPIHLANNPITVSAGADQVVSPGSAVTLTGSYGNLGQLGTPTFAWTVVNDSTQATIATGSAASFTFSAPSTDANYTATFTVTAGGISNSATCHVIVSNDPPTLQINGNGLVQEGQTLNLTAVATPAQTADPNNYIWSVTKDGTAYASGRGPTYPFVADQAGTYQVIATLLTSSPGATNNEGLTASTTVTVQNAPPQNVSISGPTSGTTFHAFTFTGSATSQSGTSKTLNYHWGVTDSTGTSVLPSDAITNLSSLQFVPQSAGGYNITLTVTDSEGGVGTKTVQLNVSPGSAMASQWTTRADIWTPVVWSPSQLSSDYVYNVGDTILDIGGGKILVAGRSEASSQSLGTQIFVAQFLVQGNTFRLDPSFNHDGSPLLTQLKLYTQYAGGDTQYQDSTRPGLAVQPDGKILVAAANIPTDDTTPPEPTVLRLNADGTVDTHFGNSGYATATLTDSNQNPLGGRFDAVAALPDGTIVAAGLEQGYSNAYKNGDMSKGAKFVAASFTSAGSLDTGQSDGHGGYVGGFGAKDSNGDRTGIWTNQMQSEDPNIPGYEMATSIAVQSDGKIILGGISSVYETPDQRFTLARLTRNGDLDTTSFDGGGYLGYVIADELQNPPVENSSDELDNIVLQPDGKIVAFGTWHGDNSASSFLVARFKTDGSLDSTFGNGGVVVKGAQPGFNANCAMGGIDAAGDILIAGGVDDSSSTILRLSSNGVLDTSFGNNGSLCLAYTTEDLGNPQVFTHAVFVEPDGSFYLAGAWANQSTSPPTGTYQFAMARYQLPSNAARDLRATGMMDGSVNLAWRDAGSFEDGFAISRSVDGTNFSTIGYVGADVTTFHDSTVDADTHYYYRVRAFWVTDPGSGVPTPATQTDFAAADLTTGEPNASWQWVETVAIPDQPADNMATAGYNPDPQDPNSTAVLSANTYDVNQPLMLVASGYISITDAGDKTADAQWGYNNSVPYGISNAGQWGGNLQFGIGVDDTSRGLTRYPYWGDPSTDSAHTYSALFTPTSDEHITFDYHDNYYPDNHQTQTWTVGTNTYSDSNIMPLQVAIYRQVAAPPIGLTAVGTRIDATHQSVTLSWDNASSDGQLIEIERADGDGAFAPLATVPAGTSTYTDTTVQLNTSYAYRVKTVSTYGTSGYSDEAAVVITNSPPVFDPTPHQISDLNYNVNFQVHATDPDPGDSVTYTFTNGSTNWSGLTIDNNGNVTGKVWAPAADFPWTPDIIPVRAKDQSGAYTDQSIFVLEPFGGTTTLPSINADASYSLSPDQKSATLSVAATKNGSNSGLAYSWSLVSAPPTSAPAPQFSVNGVPGASTTTVTFGAAGNYTFRVFISDMTSHATVTSDVSVTVGQTLGSLEVSPPEIQLIQGGHWNFSVTGADQFGNPMNAGSVTWSSNAPSGTYTASSSGAFDTITASVGTVTGKAFVGVLGGNTDDAPVFAVDPTAANAPPVAINGTRYAQVNLNVLGADDARESNLTYTWIAASGTGTVTFGTGPGGKTINGTNAGKRITAYILPGGTSPYTYTFTVTITDSHGNSVSKTTTSITVPDPTVIPDAAAVSILPQVSSIGAGAGTLELTATVRDINGYPVVPQPTSGLTWTLVGGVGSVAPNPNDPRGAIFTPPPSMDATSAAATIKVTYLSDQIASTTTIDVIKDSKPTALLTTPTDSGPWMIDSSTDIDGVVLDPLSDVIEPSWKLIATPLSGGAPIQVGQGAGEVGSAPLTGGYLTTLDPSLLPNGAYTLTLTVKNFEGETQTATHIIEVTNPVKAGNMTLPVTDMTIATGGLPITISRMYDSTLAGRDKGLGNGWRLELPDVNLTTTAFERQHVSDDPNHPAFVDGDLVTFTLPGGDEEEFTFTPTSTDGINFKAAFTAVNGSSTLTAWTGNSAPVLSRASTGEYYTSQGGYNPAASGFGNTYYVTTADGTVYTISASSGMVTSVIDTNGNELDYSHFSDATNPRIVSIPAGQQANQASWTTVTITRDGNGHIAAIADPQGNSVHYSYSANSTASPLSGDLTSFTDRVTVMVGTTPTAVVTQYHYDDPNLPHFLTSINDPRGVRVLSATYDDQSTMLQTLTDANGLISNVQTSASGTEATGQTATDLSGNTTETVSDSFGNPIRQIQYIKDGQGNITGYQVTEIDYTYDVNGQMKSATQYVPFHVAAPDPKDLRYSQKGSTVAQLTQYYKVGDSMVNQNDLFHVSSATVYGTNGTARVTSYSDYVDGQPTNSSQALLSPDGQGGTITTPIASDINSYDSSGNLTKSIDALGNATYYTYEQVNGQPNGHQTASFRLIPGATDPSVEANRIYLSKSDYYSSTDPNTGAVAGMLSDTTDANGKTTFYSYTPNGNVAATWSLSGNGQWVVNETLYDADGRETSTAQAIYSDASPTQTLNVSGFNNGYPTITEAVVQAPLTQSQTGYNFIGQADTTADQYTGVTRNTYDAHGNVIRTLSPDGTEERTVYDASNRVIWQTDTYASTTTYNSNGTYTNDNTTTANATHTIYDSQGRVIGTERYTGVLISMSSATVAGGVALPTTSLTNQGTLVSSTATHYDDAGRVVESVSASGLRTGTIYYPTGQVQYTGILLANAPVGGPFTTADFDPASAYTESKYDLVSGTMPSGAVYYNASIQHVYENGSWSLPETDTYFDAGGNVIKTSYPDGSFTQTLYSLYGQPITSSTLSGLGITPPNSTTEGWTGVPSGGREVVKIDQRKAGDPAVATFYLYDKAGNLTDVWQAAVTDADPSSATYGQSVRPHWQYSYLQGQQMTQVDPKGNTTSFTYDALGRELSRTLPDGQSGGSNAGHETETFSYDQYGNQNGHVDFNGNTTVNSYYTTGVHAGLIQEADYYKYPHVPSGNSPDETVIYGYDSLNRQSSVDDSVSGITSYTYDPITGNIASITSLEGTINYAYSPATGQEVRMIASHSGTVTDETDYAYDPQGRLANVYAVMLQGMTYASFAGLDSSGNPTFAGGIPLTTAYTYDPTGTLHSETDPDNTKTTYGYDVDNRLTSLTTINAANNKLIFTETYDLKNNGLRADVTDTRYNSDAGNTIFSQTKIAWTYDDDQRLTNETLTVLQGGTNAPSPYSDTFKYDLSNNRAEEDITGSQNATVTYGYNGDNQLKTETRTGDGAYAITDGYDNNGSLTSQAKTGTGAESDSYLYDARNRMISATVAGVTTTYTYDDNGVRVSETTNGVTTYYLNDPRNATGYTKAVEESTTLNGAPSRSYVMGMQVIAQKDAAHGLLYLAHDGHGSTRILLDATTYVVEEYNYDAYGNLLVSAGAQSNASMAMTKWQFAGDGNYDVGSTWTYQLSRFRDDFRFTQMDSYMGQISDPMSLQKYVYDASNPTNAYDPTGHFSFAFMLFAVALLSFLYVSDLPHVDPQAVPLNEGQMYILDVTRGSAIDTLAATSQALGEQSDDTLTRVARFFVPQAATVTSGNRWLLASKALKVKKGIDKILNHLRNGDPIYRFDATTDSNAWTPVFDYTGVGLGQWSEGDIRLGTNFFSVEQPQERTHTLIHELTHLYLHTYDGDGNGDSSIYTRPPYPGDSPNYGTNDISDRFDHADTWAAFCEQWYMR